MRACPACACARSTTQLHQQEAQRRQGQLREASSKLAVLQQQVADRDGRLGILSDQVTTLQGQAAGLTQQLREARQQLREAGEARSDAERRVSRYCARAPSFAWM